MVVRATLVAWEDGEVDGPFKIVEDFLAGFEICFAYALPEEDHCSSGPTERFVCSSGDDVCVRKWGKVYASCDETRDMRHIDDKVAADLVADFTHAAIINCSAVC